MSTLLYENGATLRSDRRTTTSEHQTDQDGTSGRCIMRGVELVSAHVVACSGREIQVRIGSKTVRAEVAIAFHRPAPADRVLVAIGPDASYVIGVLDAAPRLRLDGDFELEAPTGRIRLRAARGVEVEASRFELKADRIETVARNVVQKCANFYQSIGDLVHTRAGRVRTVVEGTNIARAARTYIRSTHETKIDGETIHLG